MRSEWIKKSLLAAFLTASCFFVSHAVNAWTEHALLSDWPAESGAVVAADGSLPTDGTDELASPESMKQLILSSGIFVVPHGGKGLTSSDQKSGQEQEPDLPPLNLASKFKVRGSVLGEGSRAFAVIEDITSKNQLLYSLGGIIPDGGELVEIQRAGVLIRQGKRQEFLPVTLQEDSQGRPVAVSSPAVPARPSQQRKILDRREVEAAVDNLNKLLAEARATPFFRNGKVVGYEIAILSPDSFYTRIGLIPGDVLTRVNGIEIRDPGQVFSLFQRVKQERVVTVDLLRGGSQATTLTYDIR